MATALLSISWTLLLVRTVLVADNIRDRHGKGSTVRWMATFIRRLQRSPEAPTKRSPTIGQSGASRFRSLHLYLLVAHIMACVAAGASLSREVFKMTDSSCNATERVFVTAFLLHQASLVLFLEGKTDVTNISGSDRSSSPCWQRWVKRFALFYSFGYQVLLALVLAVVLVDKLDPKEGECYGSVGEGSPEDKARITTTYVTGQSILVILLLLLLAVFIRPLVTTPWDGAPLRISYRRIVVRNTVCVAAITLMVVARSLLHIFTLYSLPPKEYGRGFHVAAAWQMLLTLWVTEITLAIGFTSCVATCRNGGDGQKSATASEQAGSHEVAMQTMSSYPHQDPSWSSFQALGEQGSSQSSVIQDTRPGVVDPRAPDV